MTTITATFIRTPAKRQRGAVLVVSLIMLLLLTMLGLSGMRGTTLDERMAGNMRDQDLAFQAAEAALRTGETVLAPLVAIPAACAFGETCTAYARDTFSDAETEDNAWWTTNGIEYGTVGTKDLAAVTADPRYLIEENAYVKDSMTIGHGAPTGRDIYLLTARGTGQTNDADVRLQITYAKRFN